MHGIVTLLKILALWWRDCGKTGHLAWAPVPVDGRRASARFESRPVGRARFDRAQSGWMTFVPAKERFGGPPDYPGFALPGVFSARVFGGPGTARSPLISSSPTRLLHAVGRRLLRRRRD